MISLLSKKLYSPNVIVSVPPEKTNTPPAILLLYSTPLIVPVVPDGSDKSVPMFLNDVPPEYDKTFDAS